MNLVKEDIWLFEHEFKKQIPECTVSRVSLAHVCGNSILDKTSLRLLTSITRIGIRREMLSAIRCWALIALGQLQKKDFFSRKVWIADNWSNNYFHWLTDALTRLEVIRQFETRPSVVLPESLRGIGFVGQSLQFLNVEYEYISNAVIRDLVVATPTAPTGNYNAFLVNALRDRFLEARASSDVDCTVQRKVWISREKASRRKIINEVDLHELLERYGFDIVCMESFSFSEQVDIACNASVIAGLHGAGLTNMMFMKEFGTVLEIRRRGDSYNNCFYALASSLNHAYYYCTAESEAGEFHDSDCHLDPACLESVLSLLS